MVLTLVEVLKQTLAAMVLEMHINNRLVDSLPLSLDKINDAQEREGYIQGAMNHLMEIWEDLINDQGLEPDFFIRTTSFDGRNEILFS